MLQITVNGEPKAVAEGATLADLVALFDVAPERIAVEVNEHLVRRANYAQTRLEGGDRVEIVTLVGGG
jgi:thiamine biosynthesis protein ThiS